MHICSGGSSGDGAHRGCDSTAGASGKPHQRAPRSSLLFGAAICHCTKVMHTSLQYGVCMQRYCVISVLFQGDITSPATAEKIVSLFDGEKAGPRSTNMPFPLLHILNTLQLLGHSCAMRPFCQQHPISRRFGSLPPPPHHERCAPRPAACCGTTRGPATGAVDVAALRRSPRGVVARGVVRDVVCFVAAAAARTAAVGAARKNQGRFSGVLRGKSSGAAAAAAAPVPRAFPAAAATTTHRRCRRRRRHRHHHHNI